MRKLIFVGLLLLIAAVPGQASFMCTSAYSRCQEGELATYMSRLNVCESEYGWCAAWCRSDLFACKSRAEQQYNEGQQYCYIMHCYYIY